MPVRVSELEMVGRALPPEHHSVKSLVIRESIKQRQAQALFVETQQAVKIVTRASDPENRHHRHGPSYTAQTPSSQRPFAHSPVAKIARNR
jgi:hypothetical protein